MNLPLRFAAFVFGAAILLSGCSSSSDRSFTTDSPASTPDSRDSFSPKYEVAGPWVTGEYPPIPSVTTRDGKHVVWIYNNSGYKHVFVGDYVDDITIKGIQTRWKRADQTTTRMSITMTFLSPNSIKQEWVALDSNSDLAKGQTGIAFVTRLHPVDASLKGTDSPDDFSPTYEYAGHWLADGEPTPSDVTRDGKHVVSIYNNGGYKHVFKGDYVDGTTIKGIQIRWKRADQTTTRMRLTLTFLSPTSIRVDWVALDSNSDLTKGQTGVSFLQPASTAPPASTKYDQPHQDQSSGHQDTPTLKGVD